MFQTSKGAPAFKHHCMVAFLRSRAIKTLLHGLTIVSLLTLAAGTLVGDNNNDKGKDQVCWDDAGNRPRFNPIAGRIVCWRESGYTEQMRRMEDERCEVVDGRN